jgi:hypothetical protein
MIVMGGNRRLNRPAPYPGVHLRDTAREAGLNYVWQIEGGRTPNILQTIGNGCAFLDFNNDNNLDILLIGTHPALYQGNGKGQFIDVTATTGLSALTGQFLGCAVGDIDGDGYDDIYISGYQTGILLHNEAGKNFRDITEQSGLKPQPWGTSCAFAETSPGSGKLDLYIANYVVFGPDVSPQLCTSGKGVSVSCGPEDYAPLKGAFYRNDGTGRFTDETKERGLDTSNGKGLGVFFANLKDPRTPYLLVANDRMYGDLFDLSQSKNSTPAKNIGVLSGVAYDRDGNSHAGMGIDCGDYDNDGRLDIFVTTFANEPRSLYRNNGEGQFSDIGMSTGFDPMRSQYVAFGCKFFDFDNDGWLDIIIANGHVQAAVHDINPGQDFKQPIQLFRNSGGAHPGFDDVSPSSSVFNQLIIGRGLATGDYDNDGNMDVLVVDSSGKPLLLHNESGRNGHWLTVQLIGKQSNRNGYGAMLTAKAGAHTFLRASQTCGSYFSASDKRVHFGLGNDTKVDSLTVKWPSGKIDTFKNLTVDRMITLQEGDQTVH